MENKNHNDDDEPMGLSDAMMLRGDQLRQLRLLAEADDAMRQNEPDENSYDNNESNGKSDDYHDVIDYESYLSHQRYYDDFKHVNMKMIDYGEIKGKTSGGGGRVIIEQRKDLGKGGFCWDAGFILGEHLISNEGDWCGRHTTTQHNQQLSLDVGEEKSCHENDIPIPYQLQKTHYDASSYYPKIIELGGGTGLSGLMIAKAVPCHVTITDLPEMLGLIRDNLRHNFDDADITPFYNDPAAIESHDKGVNRNTNGDNFDDFNAEQNVTNAKGKVWSKILRWGHHDDLADGIIYDVIIGADIIASIYNPHALAQTLYTLSGPDTMIYISYKERLVEPLSMFENEIGKLFRHLRRRRPMSRNRNPDIWIMEIGGKI